MSRFKDYARLCHYNPLTMLSPFSGMTATVGIDGWLDHDSVGDIPKIIVSPLAIPLGTAFIGLELAVDLMTRPSVAKHKFHNLVEMARNNNKIHPSRSYDMYWSLEAEAAQYCERSRTMVHLRALSGEIAYDWLSQSWDKNGINIFHFKKEEVYDIFERLGVKQMLEIADRDCEKHGKECLADTVIQRHNPIDTYEEYLKKR